MSDVNVFKLAKIFNEVKDKVEIFLPCVKAYENDKLSYTQEIKLVPKIVKVLEKKFGIEKAIEEFHLVVYDIEKTMSSVREDVNKKEYIDTGVQLAKGIENMLPSIAELLPIIVPTAVNVAEDVSTSGEHLIIEGLKGALFFVENAVNATCTVLEDYHNSNSTTNVGAHDEL
ncbi:MAG: hypothetical protein AB8B46_00685 [Candidatus Midichloriaceae bacterium]